MAHNSSLFYIHVCNNIAAVKTTLSRCMPHCNENRSAQWKSGNQNTNKSERKRSLYTWGEANDLCACVNGYDVINLRAVWLGQAKTWSKLKGMRIRTYGTFGLQAPAHSNPAVQSSINNVLPPELLHCLLQVASAVHFHLVSSLYALRTRLSRFQY